MNRRKAFTIVELMVSIALVVVLMLGVGTVFRTVSATVSSGQAISDNVRVARAAQATFARDFGGMVTDDAPFIVIHSAGTLTFRNRADDLGDIDRNAQTMDLNGNNVEAEATVPGEIFPFTAVNNRMHRIDSMAFFVRDLMRRQTGNPDQNMISPMTRGEAFIKYGHTRVWDGSGPLDSATSFLRPGEGTFTSNKNNYYPSQWIIGRMAMLLSDGDAIDDTDNNGYPDILRDGGGVPQRFVERKTAVSATSHRVLAPLSEGSQVNTGTQPVIQESVTDLAGITIDQMRNLMQLYTNDPGSPTDWADRFIYRFCVNPLMPQPINVDTLAQTVPVFIPGATQFIVEYAGDFIRQDNADPTATNYGNTLATYLDPDGADGLIDYVLVGTPASGYRKAIRWYGLPRDAHGTGVVIGRVTANPTGGTAARDMINVVPLRDVFRNFSIAHNSGAPFEKIVPNSKDNYATIGISGMQANDAYQCAWTVTDPVKPKMIRITLVIDDPAGRLQEGQTFEYVFELP